MTAAGIGSGWISARRAPWPPAGPDGRVRPPLLDGSPPLLDGSPPLLDGSPPLASAVFRGDGTVTLWCLH